MIFIDTNIILRFILADDKKLSPKAERIFSKISEGDVKVFLSSVIIAETVYVLLKVYKIDRQQISQKLLPILKLKNVTSENKNIYSEALNIFSSKNVDFEDAFSVALMSKKKIKQIYSFDEDFNKFPQIIRLET